MPFYCLRCGECCLAMGDVTPSSGDPVAKRCVVVNRSENNNIYALSSG